MWILLYSGHVHASWHLTAFIKRQPLWASTRHKLSMSRNMIFNSQNSNCSQHCREGWVSGIGMRPRLWRNRLGDEALQAGLQEMETSLKRSSQQMQQGTASSNSSRLSSSQLFSDAALKAAYLAPWMDLCQREGAAKAARSSSSGGGGGYCTMAAATSAAAADQQPRALEDPIT
jgi:hypothetical protein